MLYLMEASALQTLRENQYNAPPASDMLAYLRDTPVSAGPVAADGHVATIAVEGVLTPQPNLFARLFLGANTTYAGIRSALSAAKSDPSISHVVLRVSSPGGTVDGLFETLEAIKDFKASGKTMSVTTDLACSAAYAIAAVAGDISAIGDWATIGSVGVAASYLVDKERVDVTSTDAPNKRPDLTTNAGKAVVRKRLDDTHALFVRYIAAGRGLPTTANFGKGGTMLAREALGLKMIDSIGNPSRGANGARAMGPITRKALELRAMMGDDEAAADLMIQRMQSTGPARSRAAMTTMSREDRFNAVADVVCGTSARDMGDDVADLMFGKPPAPSQDSADRVADIVCGVERDSGDDVADIMFGTQQRADKYAGRDPADVVADIVSGRSAADDHARDDESGRDAGDEVADIMFGRRAEHAGGVRITRLREQN